MYRNTVSIVLVLVSGFIAGCSAIVNQDNRTIESLESLHAQPTADSKTSEAHTAKTKPVIVTGHKTAIRQYRQFLATQPDYPLKAEAMRRLIDLEAEGQPSTVKTERGVSASKSTPYESARLYERLLAAYPQYPGNDMVLYQLARVYGDNGKQHKALASLTKLVQQYPHTSYYAEAQFRRGELFFLLEDYGQAEMAYKAVVEGGSDNFFYEKAMYMYGWTLYKRRQYRPAITVMKGLLDSNIGIAGDAADKEEMIDDCLRVSSLSFMHLGGHSEIAAYFNKNGKPRYEWRIYKKLGDIHMKQNRIQDAAASFSGFARANPFHVQAPEFQLYVIDAYEKGKFIEQAIKAKTVFVNQYGVESEYWKRIDTENRSILNKHIKTQLSELAGFYHSRAQKQKLQSNRRQDFQQAAHWYEKHLASFPGDNGLGNVAWLLAESYYELGQFNKAVIQYEKSAYEYDSHKKTRSAAYAALLAYEKMIGQVPGDKGLRRKQISSALRFAQTYPDDRRTTAVLAKVAEDYYAMGDMRQAQAMATRVLEYSKPRARNTERRTARVVLAHASFELARYSEAETAYRQLLKSGGFKPAQQRQFRDRLASSIYKQGEKARDNRDYTGAAALFLKAGRAAADSSISAAAEYDAAASYASAKQWGKASRILESFQRRYPGHKLQSEATEKLAFIYTETGNSSKASALYERIAHTSRDPEVRRDALWKSAEFSEKGRNYSKAIGLYKQYVTRYGKSGESAIEAGYRLADLYGRSNTPGKKKYWQQKLVEDEARLGKQRTERTRYLAAMTSLELAEPDLKQYQQVRLVRPLKKSLKQKKARMELALLSYGRAADYGVADVTTASTYRIAQIYQDFGEKLLDSQRPKGLSGLELEQYNVLLEEQAFPFEEKAIETHEINASRVKDGIYNKWVKKSFDQLGKLRPARYAKQERRHEVIHDIH